MDNNKLLEMAKELLKSIQENPEKLNQELEKASSLANLKVSTKPNKQKSFTKDDKPHPANSPEDKAHDVAEDGEMLPDALSETKGDKSKMLSHLRTLTDESKMRSPENKKIGETKKGWQKTEATALMLSEKWEPKFIKNREEVKKEEALDKGKLIDFKTKKIISDTGEPEKTPETPSKPLVDGPHFKVPAIIPSGKGLERIAEQQKTSEPKVSKPKSSDKKKAVPPKSKRAKK